MEQVVAIKRSILIHPDCVVKLTSKRFKQIIKEVIANTNADLERTAREYLSV